MNEERKNYEILDLLRIFAALMIFVYHSQVVGEIGQWGVEIFAIISGMCVMLSTEEGSHGRHSFMLRKLIRIVPMYWIATIAMYLIIQKFPQLSVMSVASPEYLVKSMLFIPYTDSAGNGSVPILGAGWYLQYQMFFYLIVWIVLSGFKFFCKKKESYHYRGYFVIGICFTLALFNIVALALSLPIPYVLKYYSDLFIIEFALGVFLYYLVTLFPEGMEFSKKTSVLIFIGVICFVIYVNYYDSSLRLMSMCLPILFGMICLVPAFADYRAGKVIKTLSKASYAFYLIEYFTTAAYKLFAKSLDSASKKLLLLGGILVVTVVISIIAQKIMSLIESPLIRLLNKKSSTDEE